MMVMVIVVSANRIDSKIAFKSNEIRLSYRYACFGPTPLELPAQHCHYQVNRYCRSAASNGQNPLIPMKFEMLKALRSKHIVHNENLRSLVD